MHSSSIKNWAILWKNEKCTRNAPISGVNFDTYIININICFLFNLSEWCDFGSFFDWRWRVFISRQLRRLNRAQIWCCPLSLGRRDFTTTSTRMICSKLARPGQFPIRIHRAIPCYQISQSQSLIFCDCQCTSTSWATRIILDFWCFKPSFLSQLYLCSLPDRSTVGLGHIALRDLHSCATQNQIHLKNQLECWKRSTMEETSTYFTVCQCLITLSVVAQVNM